MSGGTDLRPLLGVLCDVMHEVVIAGDPGGYAVYAERVHGQTPKRHYASWAVQTLVDNGLAWQNAVGRVFVTEKGRATLVAARLEKE